MKVLQKYLDKLLVHWPRRLPVGMTEFKVWVDRVLELSGFPNNDSFQFTLSTMILHLPSLASHKSDSFFIKSLQKAAANQVAAAHMQELKDKQQKEQEKKLTVVNDVTPAVQ